MTGPYRESAASAIQCPRCGAETPPGDIVACMEGCGVWVHAEAAESSLEPSELKPSRVTSWFREKCACPQCGTQMTLRGHDMSLFQGCDSHGFWIDDSTVTQTGLGRIAIAPRVLQAQAQAKMQKRLAIERALQDEKERKLEEQAARDRGLSLEAQRALAMAEAARAAREAEEAQKRAEREARRDELAERVKTAVQGGNVYPLVDEIMRIHDALEKLAERMTDARI